MLIFKCPTCEDSPMAFNEADNQWVCSEEECQHQLEADEADELFESGELIAFVEEYNDLDEADDEDDDDDDMDDDDDSDDDSDDDGENESFNGFENRDTWMVNLVVQNEYKVQKGALAAIREAEEDARDDAMKTYVSENVTTNEDYADIFANVDEEKVAWNEIVDSVMESAKEFDEVRADLESALGVNEEISEEDNAAIVNVFESALIVKYNELKANLEEKFENDLVEAEEEITQRLTEEMSGYLDEVIKEWLEENKLAIEQGIRTEMTESFMDGLAELFKNHYIEVPEDRFDILESMSDKIEKMDEELSEANSREAALQKQLNEVSKEAIINKLSEGLTDTQVEKLDELAGSLDYESAEKFEESLQSLKESFLKTPKAKKEGDVVTTNETLNEDDDEKEVDFNDPIARAVHGLRKTS